MDLLFKLADGQYKGEISSMKVSNILRPSIKSQQSVFVSERIVKQCRQSQPVPRAQAHDAERRLKTDLLCRIMPHRTRARCKKLTASDAIARKRMDTKQCFWGKRRPQHAQHRKRSEIYRDGKPSGKSSGTPEGNQGVVAVPSGNLVLATDM